MYWPLSSMYSENFGFGQEVFVIRGTFVNGKKGLLRCKIDGCMDG